VRQIGRGTRIPRGRLLSGLQQVEPRVDAFESRAG
jgi:hypothetical protein